MKAILEALEAAHQSVELAAKYHGFDLVHWVRLKTGVAPTVEDLHRLRLTQTVKRDYTPLDLVRYCPACGTVGPVVVNCCPDHGQACYVPAEVAAQAARGLASSLGVALASSRGVVHEKAVDKLNEIVESARACGLDIANFVPVSEREMIAYCERFRGKGMRSADYLTSKIYSAQWHVFGAWYYWQAKNGPVRAALSNHYGVYLVDNNVAPT